MLEGKNAHYQILRGLGPGWLCLMEEKVDNGKLMAGLDKPRLIFKTTCGIINPRCHGAYQQLSSAFVVTINMQFVFWQINIFAHGSIKTVCVLGGKIEQKICKCSLE